MDEDKDDGEQSKPDEDGEPCFECDKTFDSDTMVLDPETDDWICQKCAREQGSMAAVTCPFCGEELEYTTHGVSAFSASDEHLDDDEDGGIYDCGNCHRQMSIKAYRHNSG